MNVIAARLRELGLDPRTEVGGTGVVAVWDSGRPGPTVLARADMDALPVEDATVHAYRSTVDGKNHACGHDGHVAVLLSVAETLLHDSERLRGRVVFVFQPAADRLLVRLQGRGGHAAMPHQTVDPIVASAQLITALQTLVSRETDPVDPVVISLTKMHGGTAFNIVPEAVEIGGTLRTFADATRDRLEARIREVAGGVARTYCAKVQVDWLAGSPAVVNDVTATERMSAVAGRIVGADRVVRPDPIMGGDDMALWLRQAPGCYFFVGVRGGEASSWPHHHPRFDLDEAALPVAVELFAEGVADLLAR
ncbi:MAG: M20 family metallopeptidase [Trueperaceae bacterium]